MATPAEAHAAWASPEQSKPIWHGPVPPYTYGQPICAYSNATALSACDPVGPVYVTFWVLPFAPIVLLLTVCCCGTVRLSSVVCSVAMSLPREFLWSASWVLSAAIPLSVRCCSCSTPASWLASVSSCVVSALRLPDSSISSEPCCRTTDASPEVSTPAIEVAPVSSKVAAAIWATVVCAARNSALAWFTAVRTWASLVCAAESCSPTWSSCSVTLSYCDVSWFTWAWTWATVGCGEAPATEAKTASPPIATSPVAIATPRRNRDSLPAGRVPTCLPRSLSGHALPRVCPGRPGHIWGQRSEGKWAIQPVPLIPTTPLQCRESPARTVPVRYHNDTFVSGKTQLRAAEVASTRVSGGTRPASARTRSARSSACPR